MKMASKKILVLVSVFCILFLGNYFVIADSGFDSSWDSGSSSSSSSWGSDSSWNDSSWDFGLNSSVSGIIYDICIFGFYCIIAYYVFKSFKKSKSLKSIVLSDSEVLQILGQNFDIKSFCENVYDYYKKIQLAWMNRDIDSVRDLLSDEMFNMYKMQIDMLKSKKQTNVMDDFECVNVFIIGIDKKDGKETINVRLVVNCRDYLIQDFDNKVIRGNKDAINNYIYDLSFIRTVNPSLNDKCPNCGASINGRVSIKCDYCASIIRHDSDSYVMASKKMVYQSVKEYKKKEEK